jgi:hypothetical protein
MNGYGFDEQILALAAGGRTRPQPWSDRGGLSSTSRH